MDEDFYIGLLYKKLNGSISETEQKQLATWIAQSEEHQLTAQSVTIAWEQSEHLYQKPSIDLDEAFDQLDEQIEKESITEVVPIAKPTIGRRMYVKWGAIAAGLIVLIIAGITISPYLTSPTVEFVTIQTTDATKTIYLPDQTQVNLNKGSLLKYPAVFSDSERQVSLEGEAFFEVNHNPAKPFTVETTNGLITVLGTTFNVRSYLNEQIDLVQVATGKVQVVSKWNKEKVLLTAGNQARLNKVEKTLSKIKAASPNNLYWHSQQLVFNDTPIKEAIATIEKIYEVSITIENPNLTKCGFNATFGADKIESVLATIETVLDVTLVKNGNNSYLLKGGQCE